MISINIYNHYTYRFHKMVLFSITSFLECIIVFKNSLKRCNPNFCLYSLPKQYTILKQDKIITARGQRQLKPFFRTEWSWITQAEKQANMMQLTLHLQVMKTDRMTQLPCTDDRNVIGSHIWEHFYMMVFNSILWFCSWKYVWKGWFQCTETLSFLKSTNCLWTCWNITL